MKLDTRRTVLVGLAFMSISTFWQMYDSVVPLILTKTFALNETWSGAIMAADNILALFLLPLFGGLSDKLNTRIGRRMPFILCGTAGAVVLIIMAFRKHDPEKLFANRMAAAAAQAVAAEAPAAEIADEPASEATEASAETPAEENTEE